MWNVNVGHCFYTGWPKSLSSPDDYNTESYLAQSDCLAADNQGQGDTRLTLTPSVIPNSNYVIMVTDWNCLKYFCVFLYCNRQVHRDFLITLYYTMFGCCAYERNVRTCFCIERDDHIPYELWTNWENSPQIHHTTITFNIPRTLSYYLEMLHN
jgi:hypothetical protein